MNLWKCRNWYISRCYLIMLIHVPPDVLHFSLKKKKKLNNFLGHFHSFVCKRKRKKRISESSQKIDISLRHWLRREKKVAAYRNNSKYVMLRVISARFCQAHHMSHAHDGNPMAIVWINIGMRNNTTTATKTMACTLLKRSQTIRQTNNFIIFT